MLFSHPAPSSVPPSGIAVRRKPLFGRAAATIESSVHLVAQPKRSSQWTVACLALAHCSVDIYSSALGALQPYLLNRFSLSLTEAGLLGGVLVLFSYILQPVFGVLADRYPTRAYAVGGPALAAVAISCLGLSSGYAGLIVMIALGGIG